MRLANLVIGFCSRPTLLISTAVQYYDGLKNYRVLWRSRTHLVEPRLLGGTGLPLLASSRATWITDEAVIFSAS